MDTPTTPAAAPPAAAPGPDLLARYTAARQREAALNKIQGRLGLLLAVLLIGFLTAIVFIGYNQYSATAFSSAFEEHQKPLMAKFTEAGKEIVKDAMPTYQEQAQIQLKEALPLIQNEAIKEATLLSSSLRGLAEREIQKSLGRVVEQQATALEGRVPGLKAPENLALLHREIHDALDEETRALFLEFHEHYAAQLAGIDTQLKRFAPSRFDDLGKEILGRVYIHLWLSLLDNHMVGDLPKDFWAPVVPAAAPKPEGK